MFSQALPLLPSVASYLRARVFLLLRLSLLTRFFLHLALIFAQIGLQVVSNDP